MSATGTDILMLLSVPVVLLVWWLWLRGTGKKAKQWPKTEATIQNVLGAIEVFAQASFNTLSFPVFAFSYEFKGEYYSGRFALVPHTVEYDESLIDRMIGRKLAVCCDPAHPDRWLIPDEMIDGYKVEQKRNSHRILSYMGLSLFLVSFLLPALGSMSGFESAFFGIIFVRPWEPDHKISALAAFGAWLNPELLLLFFLSVFQRCSRLRVLLVFTILFSIPMTWIALHRMDLAGVAVYPLGPGHFLWISGILLIVIAELSVFRFSHGRLGDTRLSSG